MPQELAQASGMAQMNPYVSIMTKKTRGYKKKLEKVRLLEQAVKDGKTLNEQQIEVLTKKDEYERYFNEFDGVRSQLVDVQAKEQQQHIEAGAVDSIVETSHPAVNKMPADSIERLLRILHVATQLQILGAQLPPALDQFSKAIVGNNHDPLETKFTSSLAESVEVAGNFLQRSELQISPNISYAQLEDMVLSMAKEPCAQDSTTAQ